MSDAIGYFFTLNWNGAFCILKSFNPLVELNLVEGNVTFDVQAVGHLIRSSVTEIAVVTTINIHLKIGNNDWFWIWIFKQLLNLVTIVVNFEFNFKSASSMDWERWALFVTPLTVWEVRVPHSFSLVEAEIQMENVTLANILNEVNTEPWEYYKQKI